MTSNELKLHIWLDMDETLLVDNAARPYLKEFLAFCFTHFKSVNIWTAASLEWYSHAFTETLKSALPISYTEFNHVWCGNRCVQITNYKAIADGDWYPPRLNIKPLRKVWKRFHQDMNRRNTLIVDNTRATYQRNYGNAIPIIDYHESAARTDTELLKLIAFLHSLLQVEDVRFIEKRFWSTQSTAVSISSEQHTIKNLDQYTDVLGKLQLNTSHVLELGVGTGTLTSLILNQKPLSFLGTEIDPLLIPKIEGSNVQVLCADLTQVDYQFLTEKKYTLICNPPYSLLPFIKTQIIDRYNLECVIIMAPSKLLTLFPDFVQLFQLSGEHFDPPARGSHLVLSRGFNASKS